MPPKKSPKKDGNSGQTTLNKFFKPKTETKPAVKVEIAAQNVEEIEDFSDEDLKHLNTNKSDKPSATSSAPAAASSASPKKSPAKKKKEPAKKRKRADEEEEVEAEVEEKKPKKRRTTKSSEKAEKEEKPADEKPKRKWNPRMTGGDRKALNPGSKPIPLGKPLCLQGLSFVVTGTLESLDRDEAEELIKKYGGVIRTNISGKTSFILVGQDPGESKMEKAKKVGTKQINEDDLLEMIRQSNPNQDVESEDEMEVEVLPETQDEAESQPVKASPKKSPKKASPKKSSTTSMPSTSTSTAENDLWVEKYRPKAVVDLVGNGADISALQSWLKYWEANHLQKDGAADASAKKGKKTSKKQEKIAEDSKKKKAVLISGVPGIGKTSAAKIVCESCGYDVVELNASDTRSKNSLKDTVKEMVGNRSLSEFFTTNSNQTKRKVVLIMDEVDGMASGDRGGLPELVKMIKETKIPIICICNDRSKQSLKTLITNCLELKFSRPQKPQIVKRLKYICDREGVKVEENALDHMVTSLGNDMRSILNNLQLLSKSPNHKKLTYAYTKENEITKSASQENVFQLVGDAFQKGSIKDYQDVYFFDTQLVPLFIQQNYLNISPFASRSEGDRMDKIAAAADSISEGDLVSLKIRKEQQWTLASAHSLFSVAAPCATVRGKFQALRQFDYYIQFPSGLGKISSTTKNYNLLSAIHKASSIKTTGTPTDVLLDYCPVWRDELINPLKEDEKEAIPEVIASMDEYGLTKDDLQSIHDISFLGGKTGNTYKEVGTQVKRAFTTAYNKAHKTLTKTAVSKTKVNRKSTEDVTNPDEDEEESDSEALNEFVTRVKAEDKMRKFSAKRERAAKKKSPAKKTTKKATTTRKKKADTQEAEPDSQSSSPKASGSKLVLKKKK